MRSISFSRKVEQVVRTLRLSCRGRLNSKFFGHFVVLFAVPKVEVSVFRLISVQNFLNAKRRQGSLHWQQGLENDKNDSKLSSAQSQHV